MARNRWLTCWVLVALALRGAFVLYHGHVGWQLRSDAGYYLTLAGNLRHGVYSLYHPQDIPDTTRMPGLPCLLFLLGCSVPALLALQVVVSAAKVLLVHRLALACGMPARTALLAAGLMACEPVDIMMSGSVLTET